MLQSLIILIIITTITYNKQLVMIQETFRHGARYPYHIQSADYSDIAQKTHNVAELSNQGKSMHYLLGQIVYKKYWKEIFQGTQYENAYGQTQFYVKSTDTNRTLQSAQAHLFGLLQSLPRLQLSKANYEFSIPAWQDFQTSKNISESWQIFQTSTSFHPIPIHSQKRGSSQCDSGDFLLKFEEENCPNQKYWMAQNKISDQSNNVMRDSRVQAAVLALEKAVGKNVSFWDVYKWTDSHTALEYLGQKKLEIISQPKHQEIFKFISVYSTYKQLFSQHNQLRTVSTPYLLQTLSNLEASANKTFTPKIVIYSAHDTTIAMVLAALGLVDPSCIKAHYLDNVNNADTCIYEYPQYSSNIIFELWNNNNEYTVKMLYNGEIKKIPICGGKVQCSLKEFGDWVRKFAVQNVQLQCGFVRKNKTYYAIIFLFSIVIAFLSVYACFLNIRIRKIDTIGKAKKQGYIENFQQKNGEEIQK